MCQICTYNQVQDIDRALLAGATLWSGFIPKSPNRRRSRARPRREISEKLPINVTLNNDYIIKYQ
jgi:hypothetical protein